MTRWLKRLGQWRSELLCWMFHHDWKDATCVGRGIICWRCMKERV